MRRDVDVEMSTAILADCCWYVTTATASAELSSFPPSHPTHSTISRPSCRTVASLTASVETSCPQAELNFATRRAISASAVRSERGSLLQVLVFRRFFFRGVDVKEDEVGDSIEDELS